MPNLKTGILAPKFSLPNQHGDIVSLKDLQAKYTVLYFYPKDLTPGCTLEAQEFSKYIKEFSKLDSVIVGVSGGDATSKAKFCSKHKLKHLLLADENFSVAKKFGAYGKKQFMGNTFNGIFRKTFVINDKGKIVHIYPEVKPEGHAAEVLKFIKGIGKKFEKGRGEKNLETPKRNKRLTKGLIETQAKESMSKRGKVRAS